MHELKRIGPRGDVAAPEGWHRSGQKTAQSAEGSESEPLQRGAGQSAMMGPGVGRHARGARSAEEYARSERDVYPWTVMLLTMTTPSRFRRQRELILRTCQS